MYKILCFLAVISAAFAQGKVQWSFCGSSVLEINHLDLGPMPILQPGKMPFILSGRTLREIRGNVKSVLKIARTFTGLSLPITCYLVNGNQVGSCSYPDLCVLLKQIFGSNTNCSQNLIDNSIDCSCPFEIPARNLDINTEAYVPDMSASVFSFFGNGDYDINIKASDAVGQITCLDLKLSLKPKTA